VTTSGHPVAISDGRPYRDSYWGALRQLPPTAAKIAIELIDEICTI